jgi:hypothetical protein
MRTVRIVLTAGVVAASVAVAGLPAGASEAAKGKPHESSVCTTIKATPSISAQAPQLSPAAALRVSKLLAKAERGAPRQLKTALQAEAIAFAQLGTGSPTAEVITPALDHAFATTATYASQHCGTAPKTATTT